MAVSSSGGAEDHDWLITFWRYLVALMIWSALQTGGREMAWLLKVAISDVWIAPVSCTRTS